MDPAYVSPLGETQHGWIESGWAGAHHELTGRRPRVGGATTANGTRWSSLHQNELRQRRSQALTLIPMHCSSSDEHSIADAAWKAMLAHSQALLDATTKECEALQHEMQLLLIAQAVTG